MTGSFIYALLADGVVICHLAFIVFVVLGGMCLFVWPRLIWVHLPCTLWGITIELGGGICPLTPLENALRSRQGADVYTGDFIIHCLEGIVYPQNLTRELQIIFGLSVIAVNVLVYGAQFLRHTRMAQRQCR